MVLRIGKVKSAIAVAAFQTADVDYIPVALNHVIIYEYGFAAIGENVELLVDKVASFLWHQL